MCGVFAVMNVLPHVLSYLMTDTSEMVWLHFVMDRHFEKLAQHGS
jgi:hypothetical protein